MRNLIYKTDCELSARLGKRALYFFLRGDLDGTLPSALDAIERAHDERRRVVVVDLREASAVLPRALEWLEGLIAKADALGLRVRVVAPKESRVRRILELLQFDRFVFVCCTLKDAARETPSRHKAAREMRNAQ